MSHENSHPVVETVGRLGMGGLALVGGLVVAGAITELVHPFVHIHIGAPGSTTPKASAEVRKDTVEVFQGKLNACAGHVTEDVAGTSSSREFWLSGFTVNQLYPVTWNNCGPAGVELNGKQTINPAGKVVKISVTETNYNEDSVRVDAWNALSCLTLPKDATVKQIKQNEQTFNKDLKEHKTIACTTSSTEHPTGLGAVTPGTAYGNMDGAADSALVAAALTPQSVSTQRKIDRFVVKDATIFLKSEFPYAQVSVKPAPIQSPVKEFEANWINAETNMKKSLLEHTLVPDGNSTGFQTKLAENNVSGTEIIPVRYSERQAAALNTFMNAPLAAEQAIYAAE
jgi:hypothetical protein